MPRVEDDLGEKSVLCVESEKNRRKRRKLEINFEKGLDKSWKW